MGVFDILQNSGKPIKKTDTVPSSQALKVFIVDDNDVFARLIEQFLKVKEKDTDYPVTYQTRIFSSGEKFLNELHENPHVVILDYYLTGNADGYMNGDKVFKKIMENNPEQKVILLSGQEDAKVVHSLVKMGLRNYIMKDDDEMFDQLHQALLEIAVSSK